MNWVSDGLRDHLVRAGHSPTEEARSNGRPPDLQQGRRTRGQSPSTGPKARELALLPASSRGLSRDPRHSAASPANSRPQSRTQGLDLRQSSGLDTVCERASLLQPPVQVPPDLPQDLSAEQLSAG